MIEHPIHPIYDEKSKILILGSFPSVKSREERFFYGHPQNRFWKVTSAVFEDDTPHTVEEKKSFLLRNRIAVWD
ncbi:MAG: DNA-deoxyinosine glycosylase, partial [Butyrivibrio hungatei]|nr:DNA-deoxyinosine glycosylase [Butyrivibrio hungatei]